MKLQYCYTAIRLLYNIAIARYCNIAMLQYVNIMLLRIRQIAVSQSCRNSVLHYYSIAITL